jgi:hypothetical protein
MKTSILKHLSLAALVALAAGVTTVTPAAADDTIIGWNAVSPSEITFTQDVADPSMSTISYAGAVQFNWGDQAPGGLTDSTPTDPIDLTITGAVDTTAAEDSFSGVDYQGLSLTYVFTDATTNAELFEAQVTAGTLNANTDPALNGVDGTTGVQYTADAPPATIVLNSFNGATWINPETAGFTVSGLTSDVGINGSYLASFEGTPQGSIAGVLTSPGNPLGSPIVPEPNPAVSIAVAMIGLAGLMLVKRLKSSMSF